MERNHVGTALYKPVCQGRHTAQGPESEKKHYVEQTNYTKKQRQGEPPNLFKNYLLGDASKYTEFAAETLKKPQGRLPL